MKFKDVLGFVFIAFLIIFYGSVFSAYLVFALELIDEDISPGVSELFVLFIMALLTSMCFLLLYSRAKLSKRQVIVRYIIGTSIALILSYLVIHQRGWIRRASPEGLFPIIVFMVILCIMGTVLLISVKWRNNNMKAETMEQERELYYRQLKVMQVSLEQQKSIRHDIKLHLAVIKRFLLTDQEGEAVKYLEKISKELEIKEYIQSNNIPFDSIVNYKLSEAKSDVKINVNVAIPKEIKMDTMDIVIIMGNLIENALEAVERVKEKRISLDVFFDRGNLFINIKNTFDGEVRFGENLATEKGIISRKSGRDHGYGLKNVKRSVEKYNGKLEISYDKKYFNVNVLVYLSPSGGEKEKKKKEKKKKEKDFLAE